MRRLRNDSDVSAIKRIRTESRSVLLTAAFVVVLVAASCIVLADQSAELAPGRQQTSSGREALGVPMLAGAELYALCVGISRYRDRSVPGLKWSAKDAKDFGKFLSSQKDLYKNINVTLLLDYSFALSESIN